MTFVKGARVSGGNGAADSTNSAAQTQSLSVSNPTFDYEDGVRVKGAHRGEEKFPSFETHRVEMNRRYAAKAVKARANTSALKS